MNQNGDFFWRRRRREDGAGAGSGARRGSGRGGEAGWAHSWCGAQGGAGAAVGRAGPALTCSAQRVRPGQAGAEAGAEAGARGAGAGSGRRTLRAVLRTCALPPLPPLTVLLRGGGGRGRTLALFTRQPLRGRGQWGLPDPRGLGCELRSFGGTCLQDQEACHACLGQESLC